jgi:hypothetical protein
MNTGVHCLCYFMQSCCLQALLVGLWSSVMLGPGIQYFVLSMHQK